MITLSVFVTSQEKTYTNVDRYWVNSFLDRLNVNWFNRKANKTKFQTETKSVRCSQTLRVLFSAVFVVSGNHFTACQETISLHVHSPIFWKLIYAQYVRKSFYLYAKNLCNVRDINKEWFFPVKKFFWLCSIQVRYLHFKKIFRFSPVFSHKFCRAVQLYNYQSKFAVIKTILLQSAKVWISRKLVASCIAINTGRVNFDRNVCFCVKK